MTWQCRSRWTGGWVNKPTPLAIILLVIVLLQVYVCEAFYSRKAPPNIFKVVPHLYATKIKKGEPQVIANNRKSGNEYEFTETFEAGIMLVGSEVKSCRKGTVQLSDAAAEIRDGECWLINCHIAEHDRTGRFDQHKPKRIRKLLLHNREILKLEQRGKLLCYITPSNMYTYGYVVPLMVMSIPRRCCLY
jgi:SsrA-binding protein